MERTRLGAAVVATLLSCTMAACDGGVLTPKVNQATEQGEVGGASIELPQESTAEGSDQAVSSTGSSQTEGSDAKPETSETGTAETASSPSGTEAAAPAATSASSTASTDADAATSASTDAAQSSEDVAEDSSFDQLAELLRPQGIKSTTSPERSITVSGTGSVSVVPDKARISVSVTTRADTAEQAKSTHASEVASVVAAVVAEGVAEKDIQTANAFLMPVYGVSSAEEPEADEAAEATTETAEASLVATTGESVVVGYEMTTTIGVGEVSVDAAGDLIDACVAAGATGVSGPSYYVSGYDDAYEQALLEAVTHARTKAEALAGAVDAQVTQVISIEEGYENGLYRGKGGVEEMGALATNGSYDSYEISPGEVTIEAQVSVCYGIV